MTSIVNTYTYKEEYHTCQREGQNYQEGYQTCQQEYQTYQG